MKCVEKKNFNCDCPMNSFVTECMYNLILLIYKPHKEAARENPY